MPDDSTARMCSLKPLEYCRERSNHGRAVEIGTYYAGWTAWLSQNYHEVISLQTPNSKKLNHVEDTDQGEFSEGNLPWKTVMRERLPNEYHGLYDFNFLAQRVSELPNVACMLCESPPAISWTWGFDLCTIDMSRDPEENLKQYRYWSNWGNKSAIMLIGIYRPRDYDRFNITVDDLLGSIEHQWEFLPFDNRYIMVRL